MDTESSFVSLNVLNRQVVGALPQTTLGKLPALSQIFTWRGREHPLPKTHSSRPSSVALQPSALWVLPFSWLVGWGLTALLTQNRSYRACRFVGIFYSKL